MNNSKTKYLSRLSAFAALVASSVAIPAMAELKEECLFKGEILQKQADTPLQIRFTGINDGENARCRANRRGARSTIQFKASPDIQALPVGSEVLYRYQQLKDGDVRWKLISAQAPVLLNASR